MSGAGPSTGSPLFARHLVSPGGPPPVVVVGLPRSGSSYLAHVLSAIDDWYVFDDLYPYQKAQAIDPDGPLDDEQVARYLHRIAWETRAQVKWPRPFHTPEVSLADIDRWEAAMRATFAGTAPRWHDLASEWMTRLALHHGCTRWGYKTPQDVWHMDTLGRVWPGIRFVHVSRDPRDVMASLKGLTARRGGDGDPRQYHPLAYALYWRMAHRRVSELAARGGLPIEVVRFDDLVERPDAVASRLAGFLDSSVGGPVTVDHTNTSFASGPRRPLTPTEVWVCERMAGPDMVAAGYELAGARPRLRDLPELARISAGFALYQARRVLRDRERRQSVRTFASRLLRRG